MYYGDTAGLKCRYLMSSGSAGDVPGFEFPAYIHVHINSNKMLLVYLTFNYFLHCVYGPYLICKCTRTLTCRNSCPILIFFFIKTTHIVVSLRGAGAFSRDFTTNLTRSPGLFAGP